MITTILTLCVLPSDTGIATILTLRLLSHLHCGYYHIYTISDADCTWRLAAPEPYQPQLEPGHRPSCSWRAGRGPCWMGRSPFFGPAWGTGVLHCPCWKGGLLLAWGTCGLHDSTTSSRCILCIVVTLSHNMLREPMCYRIFGVEIVSYEYIELSCNVCKILLCTVVTLS